jgi:mono/diheme cytochrome c family protein
MSKSLQRGLLAAAVFVALPQVSEAQSAKADSSPVARGRYLVEVAGCNDCHTAGYGLNGGKVPESEWLKGDQLGWSGPWGTTYPTNLRRSIPAMTAEQWVKYARTLQARPPMPWFNVRAMTDQDLLAIHAYVKSLGAAGDAAPAYVPPGGKVNGPVVKFPG